MTLFRWLHRQFFTRQFLCFAGIGIVAAALNWGSGRLFALVTSFSFSIELAYGVGVASAFVMNRLWVFPGSPRPMVQQIVWFMGVNLLFFPIVWGVSVALGNYVLPWLGMRDLAEPLGHAAALAFPMILTFLIHKFLTFAKEETMQESPS